MSYFFVAWNGSPSQAFLSVESPDWVFFIDCDAFFTDPQTSLADILATYGVAESVGPHFLVAEDPGGINTGTEIHRGTVLMISRSIWQSESMKFNQYYFSVFKVLK